MLKKASINQSAILIMLGHITGSGHYISTYEEMVAMLTESAKLFAAYLDEAEVVHIIDEGDDVDLIQITHKLEAGPEVTLGVMFLPEEFISVLLSDYVSLDDDSDRDVVLNLLNEFHMLFPFATFVLYEDSVSIKGDIPLTEEFDPEVVMDTIDWIIDAAEEGHKELSVAVGARD